MATAGTRTISSLTTDAQHFRARLDHGDASSAFTATWQACADKTALCAVVLVDRVAEAQRAELLEMVNARIIALEALHRAYEDLALIEGEADKTGKPRGEAPGDLESSIARYSSFLTGQVIGGAKHTLSTSIQYVTEIGRYRANQQRLHSAHKRLRSAVSNLRTALVLEMRAHDSLAESLVRERAELQRALLQSGLASGLEALPAELRADIGLARDAEQLVKRSPSLQVALEAAILASQRSATRRARLRYRSAVAVLAELETLHEQAHGGRRLSMSRLERLIDELSQLRERSAIGLARPAAVVVKQ